MLGDMAKAKAMGPGRRSATGLCATAIWPAALLAALLGARAAHAHSQAAPRITVSAHAGSYGMDLRLFLPAPRARVWRVLTDFTDIKRLNPAVKQAKVMRRDGQTLLQMHIKSCVLFICFPVTQTERMTLRGHRVIRGVIVPQLSSFRAGGSSWHLRTVTGGTEAHFRAALTPSFYIPPFLGPWMIRRKLRHEMRETAAHLSAWVAARDLRKASGR